MEKLQWNVTENGGGGLTLHVFEENKLIYAHSGQEYNPTNLLEDIATLEKDGHVDGWEGNDLEDEERIRAIRDAEAEKKKEITEENYYSNEKTTAKEEDIFNKDGNIIALTYDEYYDDQDETSIIANQDGINDSVDMGRAGQEVFYPNLDDESDDE